MPEAADEIAPAAHGGRVPSGVPAVRAPRPAMALLLVTALVTALVAAMFVSVVDAGSAGKAGLAHGKGTRTRDGAVTAAASKAGAGDRARAGNAGTGNKALAVDSGTRGACAAFPGARQLPGADGVVPAAWSGGGLVVPACGPPPGDGPRGSPVYPYPGALWTAGYQCVEFSERYLYERFGVMLDVAADGDQVAARYAAAFPGLFLLVRNGAPHRAPAAGDVLSLSAAPGFDAADGGHTAVVQASAVNAAGDGTVTVVAENAGAAGVTVVPMTRWRLRFPGFPYAQWLALAGLTVTAPHPPTVVAGRGYAFALTAAGGVPPYRWRAAGGSLPPGLRLSAAGLLAGAVTWRAGARPAGRPEPGPAGSGSGRGWRVAVMITVTDARGATAAAALPLDVEPPTGQ